MADKAGRLDLEFLISESPDRERATLVEMRDGDSSGPERREDELRELRQSPATRRRTGPWRVLLPRRSLRAPVLSLTVPQQLYEQVLRPADELYLWTVYRYVDDRSIHEESVNKAQLSSATPNQADKTVSVRLRYLYEQGSPSVEALLDKEKENPFGDYNQRNCQCQGRHDRGWRRFKRLVGMGEYTYVVQYEPGWTVSHGEGHTAHHSETFVIERHTKDGGVQWECVCGAWTEIKLEDAGRENMIVNVLYDSGSAEERVNLLRRGIPMRWRLYALGFSALSAIVIISSWVADQCSNGGALIGQ